MELRSPLQLGVGAIEPRSPGQLANILATKNEITISIVQKKITFYFVVNWDRGVPTYSMLSVLDVFYLFCFGRYLQFCHFE